MIFDTQIDTLGQLVTDAEQGNISPLRAYAGIKEIESLIDQAKKQVEPLAFEEADKYPDKTFSAEGFTFEKRTGGRSFGYKKISLWNQKKNELSEIEERAKQAFLAKEKGMQTATEDGEEIELPEVSYRKDSLVVKKSY